MKKIVSSYDKTKINQGNVTQDGIRVQPMNLWGQKI